jgi:hypothetical protein
MANTSPSYKLPFSTLTAVIKPELDRIETAAQNLI